jgi:SAM-dependent methyltransferase
MSENFFDGEALFEEYINMRNEKRNFTDLCERPAIKKIIPKDLTNMTIMDLACGYGEMTEEIANRGAKIVFGVDISEKMIEKAKREHQQPNICYFVADINKLNDAQKESFDMICSFLALHFVEDVDCLFNKIFKLLKEDGYFIFSIEHPIMTSNLEYPPWGKDEKNDIFFKLKNYFDEGERETFWFKKDIKVKCYHRKFSTIINLCSYSSRISGRVAGQVSICSLIILTSFKSTSSTSSSVISHCLSIAAFLTAATTLLNVSTSRVA